MEPPHNFHIASTSKTFTATSVMQLYEKGKIDINKPLITYLPYFKLDDDRYKAITIRQMLNQTSGMPDVFDYEWEKAEADEGAAERYTLTLLPQTWGFMQVGLDELNFSQLQSQALVRAGQTLFSISFKFIKIFSISSGPGGRNSNSQPA